MLNNGRILTNESYGYDEDSEEENEEEKKKKKKRVMGINYAFTH